MSKRVPPKPRDELRPDQQATYDHFMQVVSRHGHPGAAERAGKTLLPFLLVLPQVGKLSIDLLQNVESEIPSFPADARETASLVGTTFFRCAYMGFAHKMMAVKLGHLSQEQAETITAGRKPADLNEGCSVAYDAAHHLLETRGPLPQELWDRCVAQFGEEGTAGLVHTVSLVAWTSMSLNACDVPAPQPKAAPEAAPSSV